MKTRLWLVLGMTTLFILSSCNEDKIISNNQLIKSISVTGQDFVDGDVENTTRAAYTVDGSGFHFSWSQGDTVGIYPVGGDQVAFPISSGEGSQTAQFDGGAWALRSTYIYAAYYPFSSGNYHIDETKLPVSFIGQRQNGNNSLSDIDRFDYQTSVATRPDADGNVNIALKHLGCFVRFQLTMPVADTYKSITLQSSKTLFITSGTCDLTKEDIVISSTATSSTLAIGLNNVSTTDDNKVLTVYAMLAPTDFSDSKITITVVGTKYQSYTSTINGKNMQAGKAYSYAATFKSGTNINGCDVEWDENGEESLKVPSYWISDDKGFYYVDLGLSVNWATFNVGASAPEEYGDYFAWGETEPYYEDGFAQSEFPVWKTDKSAGYDWSSYRYYNGSSSPLAKYNKNSGYGIVDYKTVLDLEDDAAHVRWGGNWRMPTLSEFEELLDSCNWERITQNGVSGWKVTSRKDSSRSIFLPVAGWRYGSNLSFGNDGSGGYYWSSSLSTEYSYRAWRLHLYSETHTTSRNVDRSFGLTVRPVCPKEKEHEYVDLGLSVKWATCNIGAEKPEEYGDYFAWGETEPYYEAGYAQEDPQAHWKEDYITGYEWSTYEFSNGSNSTMTKYCNNSNYGNNGFTDSKTVLYPEDDAAYVNWGGNWRMPTQADFNELLNNCDWTWITQNGVNGWKITSRKDQSQSIFLPGAGYRRGTGIDNSGGTGGYWSSSLYTDAPYGAWCLSFYSRGQVSYYFDRLLGQSVRPVCP